MHCVTLQDIEPGEELLTWYEKTPLRKRKGKRRTVSHGKRHVRLTIDGLSHSNVGHSDVPGTVSR